MKKKEEEEEEIIIITISLDNKNEDESDDPDFVLGAHGEDVITNRCSTPWTCLRKKQILI